MPVYKTKTKKDGVFKYRVKVNFINGRGEYDQIMRVAWGFDEAKDLERELAVQVKEKKNVKSITLSKLYQEYLKSTKNDLRESTIAQIDNFIGNHVLKEIGERKLSKLTIPTLQEWKNTVNDKPLSLRTKQNIYSYFRALLNFGVKMEYIPTNPLPKVGNFRSSGETKKEMNYYTAEEFKKFMRAARKHAEEPQNQSAWDYYVFFAIAFYCGLRKGEIHALKWSDIDGNFLTVSRSITQKLKGEDVETPPKNKSSIRTIQIPAQLVKILKDHRARWSEVPDFNNDFRVCGGYRSLRDTSLQNYSKKIADNAEIDKIRIHDFRHSHASLLANAGINIQEVARRLGHSKIEITWNIYSHLYPRENEKAMKVLNKVKFETD